MENFNVYGIPEFEDAEIESLIDNLIQAFRAGQNAFVDTCKGVYKIWSYFKNCYKNAKNGEYYNSYSLLAKFGFDKTAVSRYKNCYERFCVDFGHTIRLNGFVAGYSPSKLFALLLLEENMLIECLNKKIIKPDMTVREIKSTIKLINGGEPLENLIKRDIEVLEEKEEEINEEDIPMAFDPKQKYDFEYFKTKSKNQIINIAWETYQAYQKLLKGKNKNGK